MPSVSTVSPTNDVYINGVLSGTKWAVDSLTYSFPTDAAFYGTGYGSGEPSNNFEAFNSLQQAAVRSILANFSSVSNLRFTEVQETSVQHGDLRYAESDSPNTAWAYYPNSSPTGGDAWFNNTKGYYDNPIKGNYAYLTTLHETGHAMGLKHLHDIKGSFGAMPSDHDSLEYSVMSYRSYVGAPTTGGYTNDGTSYPQTLMIYDIAALQEMYGANYSTNNTDTVYQWSSSTGEMFINGQAQGAPVANKIFMTVWDGGGNDTYDFSNYTTDLKVSLEPSLWTTLSTAQLADLNGAYAPGTKLAVGNIANALLYEDNPLSLIENVIGGSGNDVIVGNIADNWFFGGDGNDVLDGNAGSDTAAYSGLFGNYAWSQNTDGSWTLVDLRLEGPDGTDILWDIEFLEFDDALVSIETISEPSVPVNESPVAGNDVYVIGKNSKLTVSGSGVLSNDLDPDGDALAAILISGTSKGRLTLNADGTFSYTPAKNFVGTDSFTYKAIDASGAEDWATVNISVVGATSGGGGRGKGGGNVPDLYDDQAQAPAMIDGTTSYWSVLPTTVDHLLII